MGATVLPALEDVDPATFLPSSRSIAFRKDVWQRTGGYPEWLDYCEDLIFDWNFKSAGARMAFEPAATVSFRPRSSLRAFFRQYYRYARGDGKADLWRLRHAVRYAAYAHLLATFACLLFLRARRNKKAVTYFTVTSALGGVAYLRRPFERLRRLATGSPVENWLYMLALLPVIRVLGDLAKMLGYPAGWLWRLQHRPPEWRQ
jgi:cellulose synthase/poly-beta-1,6-N-acetylglucosamine synthase-like glycosyltransferase